MEFDALKKKILIYLQSLSLILLSMLRKRVDTLVKTFVALTANWLKIPNSSS